MLKAIAHLTRTWKSGETDRPSVSIIVSTINWSAALRCALTSIEQQTFQDFEVLIVGDACTDDSAEVVASFQDRRFRWHNLGVNHGSQSGPNNYGLQAARGDWVAYLGHDDIWHPDHLSSLLRVVERQKVAAAVATVLFYGSEASGIMAVGGAVALQTVPELFWVPPSGWLHRRSLIDRVGLWKERSSISLPVDVDFFHRVRQETAVAPSNECTVFKFDASARRDAYVHRDVSQQEEMLRKIAGGGDFRSQEMQKALQAFSRGLLLHLETPMHTDRLPGEISNASLRFRGLRPWFSAYEMVDASIPHRFTMDRETGGHEWHALESHPVLGTFRWSGPSSICSIDLPIKPAKPLQICVKLLTPSEAQSAQLVVSVDGRTVRTKMTKNSDGTSDLVFSTEGSQVDHLRITFRTALFRPIEAGQNSDRRVLGIAIGSVHTKPE